MALLPLCVLPTAAQSAPAGSLAPYALRCESLTDPVGIGRSRPQLSWKLRAAQGLRNLRQSAYEVRVGSAPGANDVWDSGRIASSAQYGVELKRPLKSDQRCFWSVRVWDGKGQPSAWSAPAGFTVGLLGERNWKGRWIGWDAPDDPNVSPFAQSSWIWTDDGKSGDRPKETRIVEKSFMLDGKPRRAVIDLTADDRFDLIVNEKAVRRTEMVEDGWRKPVRVDLAPYLVSGKNTIRILAENTRESPAGVIACLAVENGPTLVTDETWTSSGKPVKVLSPYGQGPWGRFAESVVKRPSSLYQKRLALTKPLVRATAHVTALGLVDLSINGKRVAQDLFTPGWTDYHKRVYARTYDVTKLLGAQNRLALEVGDGWYSGYVGYGRQRAHYADRPLVRAQVDLEFADGTRQTVGTDTTWTARSGDTVVQDFLIGEEYVPSQRDEAGYKPYLAKNVTAKTEPFPGNPVLPYARLKPISVTKQDDGYILDYGQNLAGFAHLKAKGRKGQRVQMQFVEVLNPDGSPYTANLRSARATDAYTFGSNGVEEWEPRFTFHGFRYLKVTGLGRKPKPEEFTAVAISSATPETGTFACSDPMLNKLAKNAWWTQKMNFIDVPTDCPQRDERLGWTGDAQAYVRTAATYSDVQPFFAKWLVTLDDDQGRDGNFAKFAPAIMDGADGGPAWADAGVICPWTIYDVYGDRRLLAEHYPAMRRFVEFTRRRSKPNLLPPDRFHCFGDWLSVNANTPNDVIYEAYFAHSTRLLAQSARVLGKREDAERYEKLFRDVRAAFNEAYVSPDGTVKGDTQTGYVLAIGFDLLDPAMRQKAVDRLIKKIEERKWHLSTGFVGTRDLMRVLSAVGRNDVAFRLLHNKDYPSWLFEVVNGATTVWERWDGWTPEKGFQDPGMNSFAHYAYGAVMGWVFATVGGIDNAHPGFSKIVIAPKIDPRLTWAKTSFESVRGPVKTEWRKSGSKVTLNVEVPPNATAEVHIPGVGPKTVGSGTYTFVGKA